MTPILPYSEASKNTTSTNSTVCDQPDHMIAYNCEDFRKLVEASGWTCASTEEELTKVGETRNTMREYGLNSMSKAQFLCRRMMLHGRVASRG